MGISERMTTITTTSLMAVVTKISNPINLTEKWIPYALHPTANHTMIIRKRRLENSPFLNNFEQLSRNFLR